MSRNFLVCLENCCPCKILGRQQFSIMFSAHSSACLIYTSLPIPSSYPLQNVTKQSYTTGVHAESSAKSPRNFTIRAYFYVFFAVSAVGRHHLYARCKGRCYLACHCKYHLSGHEPIFTIVTRASPLRARNRSL